MRKLVDRGKTRTYLNSHPAGWWGIRCEVKDEVSDILRGKRWKEYKHPGRLQRTFMPTASRRLKISVFAYMNFGGFAWDMAAELSPPRDVE